MEVGMKLFKPMFFSSIKNYSRERFLNDMIAGFVVSIIALPLSIALAIASGFSPEKGLHTAIIAGFLISFLGGSSVQIGGPTGAFMVMVYGIVLQYGMEGMLTATFMAGIMIMLMGIFGFGSMIKYIPYPVTSGFTSGIAVTIMISQIKDFFGLLIPEQMPAEFFGKIRLIAKYFYTADYQSFLLSALSLLLLFLLPKLNKKIPAALIVLIFSSLAVKLFSMDVMTVGTAFRDLNTSLPSPVFPIPDLNMMEKMFMPALAIAFLASVESLLSAVVADGMISGRHRSNTELIAQGIANMASAIFGGMPATGAIARTVANINSGATSPVAGMLHAFFLLIIMLLFMPLAKALPLSALSAILFKVAINMGEWRVLRRILSAPKSDALILFTVFIVTVIFDLVLAIEIGMVLAAFLFMKRMADMTRINISSLDASEDRNFDEKELKNHEKSSKGGRYVYEINGPFFFGAAQKFINTLYSLDRNTESLIIRMRYVNSVDATAVHAFKRVIGICKDNEIELVLCELNEQPKKIFYNTGVIDMVGTDKVYSSFEEIKAKQILSE